MRRGRGAHPGAGISGLLLATGLAAGCGPADSTASSEGVERTDSAGVSIVTSPGSDVPLSWRAEAVLRLGPAETGPESFVRVDSDGRGLGTDDRGNIHVLDRGDAEVRVFDAEGRHFRSFGRSGEGPGEFLAPTRLFVTEDGVVAVADSRKRALVRFGPDGSVMAPLTMPERSMSPFDLRGHGAGGLIWTLDDPYATLEEATRRAPRTTRLLHVPLDLGGAGAGEPDASRELATWVETGSGAWRVEPCGMNISFTRPLAVSYPVGAAGDRVAWAPGPAYEVHVAASDGSRAIVRRDLVPVQASAELAIADFSPISVETAVHDICEVTGERAVDAAGFEPVVPWITDVKLALDGRVFVERRDPGDLPARRIDVFSAEGDYQGTLPEEFPFPARFHGADTFFRVEASELGVGSIVLYRILSGGS